MNNKYKGLTKNYNFEKKNKIKKKIYISVYVSRNFIFQIINM